MSTGILLEERDQIHRREAQLLGLAFAFLCLTAGALALSPAARSGSWRDLAARLPPLTVLPLWAASAWLIHRSLGRGRPWRDPILLPVTFLLTGWGLLLIWRLSPEFGSRQSAWFLVAVVVLLEVLRTPDDLRWLRRYRYLWLTGGILLASLTLVFGTNPSGGEPRLWLGCCGLYLQPSEPLRLLLIAYLASYLADRLALDRKAPLGALLPTLAPLLAMWGVSVALLAVQRDLGTGTLFLILLALMLYLASGRWQVLLAAAVLATIGGAVGYALFGVVRLRLEAWLNPWADPTGGSYQIVQSLIAIASGGVIGRGPGVGAPGFVPVTHSDFIFSAVAEEWGLLGSLGMIALFAILVGRGLRVAARAREPFGVMLAAGVSLALGLQSLLILGGVTRLLPLTGVTLPFVSYGGSSLVTSFIALAFLLLLSGESGPSRRFGRELRRVQSGMLAGWVALALVLGWWSLYRAPVLTVRTDNPRRGLAEMYSLRGEILDRQQHVLALSSGEQGGYQRAYPEPAAYSLVGYDSLRYAQSGIEQSMDAVLRGESGHDALTIWWSHLLTGTPPPGLDVRLTVDLEVQAAAYEALAGQQGAVVVMDPGTGEILALVSAPSFDPNRLDDDWVALTTDPGAPLLNRATQGAFQPGGALAPFLLAWAEREGLAAPSDPAPNLGAGIEVAGRELGCALSVPSGETPNLALALRLGCPAPFADLGERMGSDAFEEMLAAFGFDSAPAMGLQVAEPRSGQAPLEVEELRLEAAGQGSLILSPLQMARAFSALVGGGNLPALRLIDAVRLPTGEWGSIPTLDHPSAAVPMDTAGDLVRAMRRPGGLSLGLAARAAVGAEAGFVSWFLGANAGGDGGRVVVVLLEGATPREAEAVGLQILEGF